MCLGGPPAIPKLLIADGQWNLNHYGPVLALQDQRAILVHLIIDPQALVTAVKVWRVAGGREDIACDVAGKGFGEGEGGA